MFCLYENWLGLSNALVSHMRTHTVEKPSVFCLYEKWLGLSSALVGHMRIHTGKKPCVCSVCGEMVGPK